MIHTRLVSNAAASFANQLVTLVCTFLLPRQILLYYGSDVNGLIASISQFLGFITLMEMGVGAVVQSALYKPLVERNPLQISRIFKSAQQFFNKLGLGLGVYVLLLCWLYPYFSHSVFSVSFIIPLIVALSINVFAEYYFGLTRQLLLSADQRAYVHLLLNSVALILNTTVGIVLIHAHCTIQTVQFTMALIFLVRPLGLWWFVRKHYTIHTRVELTEEPLKQKWNGVAQHLSSFLLSHTDVILLTLFSTLGNVSVYSVYYLVVAGIRRFIATLMTGVSSWFGQLYAAKDPTLADKFAFYEWLLHTMATLIFTIAGLLIVPFVLLYTQGVHDANYVQPVFGGMLLAAYALYTIRLPYLTMVLAAGHYKQTQHISFLEAGLNVWVSLIGVQLWGLCGVALGTLLSMACCTVYFAYYLKQAILNRPMYYFVKQVAVDMMLSICVVFSVRGFVQEVSSYPEWILMAARITGMGLLEAFFVNLLFNRRQLVLLWQKVKI